MSAGQRTARGDRRTGGGMSGDDTDEAPAGTPETGAGD